MKLGVAEILGKVAAAENQKDRIALLQKYDNHAVRTVLRLAYDPTLVWDLPEKWKPEYTPSIFFDQEGALYQSLKYVNKFLVDGYAGLTQEKKQLLFIQLLESLAPADAEMMVKVKDKKLPFAGIGPATVRAAYPGLLPEKEEVTE